MTRRFFRLGLLTLGLVLAARHVAAQSTPAPAEPKPSVGQVSAGVLTITPAVKLVNLGIDTNVFNLSGTERRPPDFTTTIQPQVESLVKTPSFTLRLTTLADLVYYRKYKSERSINPRLLIATEQRFGPVFSLYGDAEVGYSRSRTGLEVDARARQLGASGVAGGRLRGRKLELDVRGSYGQTQYASTAQFEAVRLADTLDRTSQGVGATFLYHATPYTAFTSGGDRTMTRFRFAGDRDIDSTRTFVGVQFNPRAVISGSAEVGYSFAQPRDSITPDFSGFTPRIGLSYRLLDTTTFTAGAHRDLEFSFQRDRPYYIFVTYEGSVRQAIAHRFDIGAGVQYSILDYRGFTGAGAPVAGADERVRSVVATIGIPIKRVRIEFYGGEWQRLSGARPYRSLRGGVQVTVGKVNLSERGIFVNGLGR